MNKVGTNHTEPAGHSARGCRALLHWADFTQDWVPVKEVLLKLLQAEMAMSRAF